MVSKEIKEMIPDFVQGLLSKSDAEKVKSGITECPELAQEYERAKRYYQILGELPDIKAPSGFLDSVNTKLDRVSFAQILGRWLKKPFTIKLPFEIIAVTACLIVVVIIFKPTSYLPKEINLISEPSPAKEDEFKIPSVPQNQTAKQDQLVKSLASEEDNRADTHVKMKGNDRKHASIQHKQEIATRKQSPDIIQLSLPDTKENASDQRPEAVSPEDVNGSLDLAALKAAKSPAPSAAGFSPAQQLPPGNPKSDEITSAPSMLVKKVDLPDESDQAVVNIGTIDISFITPVLRKKNRFSEETTISELQANSADRKMAASVKRDNDSYQEKRMIKKQTAPVKETVEEETTPETVLVKYDPDMRVNTEQDKTSYTLTITPDNLENLKHELERSFRVTLHTRTFDSQQIKKIIVVFVVNN